MKRCAGILLAVVLVSSMGVVSAAAPPQVEPAWGEPRALPQPEDWRPAPDPELPPYTACRAEVRGTLSGSAPPIMPALVKAWIAGFGGHHPGVSFDIGPPWLPPQGALDPALQDFLEGRRDFAFLSREPAAADRDAFVRHHGHELWAIPVAMGSWRHFGFVDAVAILVHEDNPVRMLDLAQLDALFSESRLRGHAPVTHWGELGVPQWHGRPVNVVGAAAWRSAESARAITLREQVMDRGGRIGRWRRDLEAGGSSEAQVPGQVAADPHAIGFTGLGHLVPGVRAVDLAHGPGGPALPADHRHAADGTYPLVRQLYLLLDPAPGRALDPALLEFARYLLSHDAQQVVADQGVFLPLREDRAVGHRQRLHALSGCN